MINTRRSKTLTDPWGITLIEVLIAMTILAAITALSAQSLKQGFEMKEKIQKNLDSTSQIRDALNLIHQDLRAVVNQEDLEIRFYEAVKKQAREQLQGQPRSQQGSQELSGDHRTTEGVGAGGRSIGAPLNPAIIQQKIEQLESRFPRNFQNRKMFQTVFRGLSDKIFFFTTHSLMTPNSENPIPPFLVRISYQVKNCPQEASKNCLIRYIAPTHNMVNPSDLERFETGTPILKDVTSFEIKYRSRLQQDWVTSWNSEANINSQKNKVPEGIELSIKVGNQLVRLVTYLAFANNRYENTGTNR